MIKNAGLGVAMGNSCPAVKKKADVVTLDNNNDGVAEIINKYIQYIFVYCRKNKYL